MNLSALRVLCGEFIGTNSHHLRSHAAIPRSGALSHERVQRPDGASVAEATLALGHEVVIVSGPVEIEYPSAATVVSVISTEEMLAACEMEFEHCDGLIGAAAPCDYRPVRVESHKIAKTGQPIDLHLIETDDVVATLGAKKGRRWVVGFALETEDHRLRALAKLERKFCDLMISNGPQAISAQITRSKSSRRRAK